MNFDQKLNRSLKEWAFLAIGNPKVSGYACHEIPPDSISGSAKIDGKHELKFENLTEAEFDYLQKVSGGSIFIWVEEKTYTPDTFDITED